MSYAHIPGFSEKSSSKELEIAARNKGDRIVGRLSHPELTAGACSIIHIT
ncbi:hypothetical protein MiSe_71780 [Microseira wollei NIES-4236]|uniref:Uncharacterized protein n=1 Tax=Microseira wollei NIES-4236 TaxID=2530354 RepID=A0AAV3XLE6_9CYAN|nr:hypothetical protein MiSe_71780 [Microseira wollei NIES-4236]